MKELVGCFRYYFFTLYDYGKKVERLLWKSIFKFRVFSILFVNFINFLIILWFVLFEMGKMQGKINCIQINKIIKWLFWLKKVNRIIRNDVLPDDLLLNFWGCRKHRYSVGYGLSSMSGGWFVRDGLSNPYECIDSSTMMKLNEMSIKVL